MRILVAEDEIISRSMLAEMLSSWGHTVLLAENGQQAWEMLVSEDRPALAILDWKMPVVEGVDVCRRLRQTPLSPPPFLILLTAKGDTQSIVLGLQAGANDYISKPFAPEELCARIHVGEQMTELQQNLADRVRQLEAALTQVQQLQGILPICSYCKKIRDDKNYWQQVETYFAKNSEVLFSHGICPDCLDREMKNLTLNQPRGMASP